MTYLHTILRYLKREWLKKEQIHLNSINSSSLDYLKGEGFKKEQVHLNSINTFLFKKFIKKFIQIQNFSINSFEFINELI